MNTVSALLAAATLLGPAMDTKIGSHAVRDWSDSIVFGGVYLYQGVDCDGAHMRLILSADIDAIANNEGQSSDEFLKWANFKPMKFVPITDSGINLGMTRAEVERILGKPRPANSFYSSKFKAHELIYSRQTPKRKDGTSDKFTNFYLFRGGKLFYIELSYDQVGGGC